jgi:hypothetical protein|uniref:RING-type domain-containing protein n=1 Tax=viral metagenome TaxID=1070528 RepID=A0A6C0LF85_9ZZZZ
MNYSSFASAYKLDELPDDLLSIDLKENKENFTADKLLNNYNTLNEKLKNNLDDIKYLEQKKLDILKYKSNVFVNHQDIMIKLYRQNDKTVEELNDTLLKYIELLKTYVNDWINNYYNDKKELLEKEITTQEEELAAFRKLFISTTTEIIKTEKINRNICPICFENEINMCSIPCGHTCCNECIIQSIRFHNTRVTKCLNCRNNVTDYIKMYIQL